MKKKSGRPTKNSTGELRDKQIGIRIDEERLNYLKTLTPYEGGTITGAIINLIDMARSENYKYVVGLDVPWPQGEKDEPKKPE